jgi:DNA helicase II / ATP-dependent DNA helicase PcrA
LNDMENDRDIFATAHRLVELTDYFSYLEKDDSKTAESKKANVEELLNSIKQYKDENKKGSIAGFLEKVALIQDGDDTDRGEQVIVLTVHSSKGLEFENVFIAGFEEGIFPHKRSLDEDHLEEERRLCYVALTRAKNRLFLSSCSTREKFGESSKCKPSRFLSEIPDELFLYPPSQAGAKAAEDGKSRIREILAGIAKKYENQK